MRRVFFKRFFVRFRLSLRITDVQFSSRPYTSLLTVVPGVNFKANQVSSFSFFTLCHFSFFTSYKLFFGDAPGYTISCNDK
jgi:hypothetical protein